MNDDPAGARDGAPEQGGIRPPTKDPWKSFRGVLSGLLILEAIVIGLAIPVVATVGGGLTAARGGYVIGLVVLMVLGAGVQGRRWAVKFDLLLQVLVVAGWWVHPAIGVVGLLFAAVWGYLLYLSADIRDRERRGLLPGQRG
ncbi:DUF4233 domain-containing protein [Tomitella gaofuii]|uniref:DUF4233 domain-containing protein n=1 Tax=Tomitella gaofuii TaxID=2760083 RepID=UPI0015F8DCED|nr:DUF4233 domain-containing protein [Tomitella gaofuii]